MKTLFVSDLDGTLLNRDAVLTDKTVEALNALIDKGLLFSVATARSRSAAEKTERLHLSLPMVQLNGVLIYDPQKNAYIDCVPFSFEQACEVIKVLRDFDRMSFVYKYEGDGDIAVEFERFSNQTESDFFEARKDKDYKRFEQVEQIHIQKHERVIYFTMVDTYERLKPIFEKLSLLAGIKPTLYVDNYSGLYYLEIFSSKATKGAAVRKLCHLVGADKVVVFGDNLNDLDMFEQADFAVAVGNAVDEAKAHADIIIDNNDNDGVVQYLAEIYSIT